MDTNKYQEQILADFQNKADQAKLKMLRILFRAQKNIDDSEYKRSLERLKKENL